LVSVVSSERCMSDCGRDGTEEKVRLTVGR
jgi:hypothetical protein